MFTNGTRLWRHGDSTIALGNRKGILWIHRGALTNQRCSLATGCGINNLCTCPMAVYHIDHRIWGWCSSCLPTETDSIVCRYRALLTAVCVAVKHQAWNAAGEGAPREYRRGDSILWGHWSDLVGSLQIWNQGWGLLKLTLLISPLRIFSVSQKYR